MNAKQVNANRQPNIPKTAAAGVEAGPLWARLSTVHCLLFTLLTLSLLAGTAQGQTVYWKGGVSTAWTTAANWTNRSDATAVLPGPGTNVVIDRIDSPTYQPLLNLSGGSVTIASLVITGSVSTASVLTL